VISLPSPEEGFQEAERRIENALHEGGQVLDLSELNLTALPESIEQLTQLRTLALRDNELTELPKVVSRITWLKNLDLFCNLHLYLWRKECRYRELYEHPTIFIVDQQLHRRPRVRRWHLSGQPHPLTSIPPEATSA